MTGPAFYTVEELSERWKHPESSIQKKIRQRRLKAFNVGTDNAPIYRIAAAEVERYENAHTSGVSAA